MATAAALMEPRRSSDELRLRTVRRTPDQIAADVFLDRRRPTKNPDAVRLEEVHADMHALTEEYYDLAGRLDISMALCPMCGSFWRTETSPDCPICAALQRRRTHETKKGDA